MVEIAPDVNSVVADGKIINLKFNFAPFASEGEGELFSVPGTVTLSMNGKQVESSRVGREKLMLVFGKVQPFIWFTLDKYRKHILAGENSFLLEFLPQDQGAEYTYELKADYVSDAAMEYTDGDGRRVATNSYSESWSDNHSGKLALSVRFGDIFKTKKGLFGRRK